MREFSSTLNTINFCLLLTSNLFFALIMLKKWKGRILDIIVPIIYPVLCTVCIIYCTKHISVINEPSSYVILFIISLVSLIILLKVSLEEAIFLSVFQVFHIIFTKGISAGVMSLMLRKNMFQLFQVEQYAQLISTLAYCIMVVLFMLYFFFINKKKLHSFFLCKGQVSYVLILHILITIYLLFKCYNFHYNLDLIWFSVDQVYTSILLYTMYFLVLKFATRISSLLQNELRYKTQNFKILNQLSSYLMYKETGEFVSLYEEKSKGIKQLIKTDKKDEVLEDIDILDKKLGSISRANFKKISSIEIINALFYEFSANCVFKDIPLTGEYFFPENLIINDKTLHEILSCLLKNSFEANLKIAEKKNRNITINTTQEDDTFKITIENPYEDKPKLNNGKPQTSKVYTEIEGLGIGYITQALEKTKASFGFTINSEEKKFISEIILKFLKFECI